MLFHGFLLMVMNLATVIHEMYVILYPEEIFRQLEFLQPLFLNTMDGTVLTLFSCTFF